MKRWFYWVGIFLMSFIIVACGGGGNDSKPSSINNTNTEEQTSDIKKEGIESLGRLGKITDIDIDGLEYEVDGLKGKTDNSHFYYDVGSKIRFYIDGIYLGEVEAKDEIYLFDIVDSYESQFTDKVKNILTLLKTYDSDHNIYNGVKINISQKAYSNSKQLKKLSISSKITIIDISENYSKFVDSLRKQKNKQVYEQLFYSPNPKYQYSFNENVVATKRDFERAFFLKRYRRYLLAQESFLRQGNLEIFNELQEKAKAITIQLDNFKEIFEGTSKFANKEKLRGLLQAVAGLSKFSSNKDITNIEIDKLFSALDTLVIMYSKNKDISKLVDVAKNYNLIMENKDLEEFFDTYGDMLDGMKGTKGHLLGIPVAAAKSIISKSVREGKLKNLNQFTGGALENTLEGWMSIGKAYISCGKTLGKVVANVDIGIKKNTECLSNIYDAINYGVVSNVSSIVASVSSYTINKDNRKMADDFEAERAALDYFLYFNFNSKLIENDYGKSDGFFDWIEDNLDSAVGFFYDAYSNEALWDKIEDKYTVDISDDAKVQILDLYNRLDNYVNASKGKLRIYTNNSSKLIVQYTDPFTADFLSLNDTKHITCVLNNNVILNEDFSNSKNWDLEINSEFEYNPLICSVTINNIKVAEEQKYIRIINNSNNTEKGDFYSPVCKSHLYLTELVLDENLNSYKGNEISTTRTTIHNGIDIGKTPIGTKVVAVKDGVVVNVANQAGAAGLYIKIKHKNYYTLYMHLSKQLVKVGQKVKAGELIGESGSSGRSSGPHLHFEVRDFQKNVIDPLNDELFINQSNVKVVNYKRGHVEFDTEEAPNCGFTVSKPNISEIPSMPEHVIASDFKYSNKIKIYGYGTKNTDHYEIYRALDEYSSEKYIATTKNTTYYDKGLSPSNRFYYKVKACNSKNKCSALSINGDYGNTKKKDTNDALSKPQLISPGSSNQPGTILSNITQALTWSSVDNAKSYWVAVRDRNTGTLIYNKRGIENTNVVISGLIKGHKYYWDVSPCNEKECGIVWADSLFFQIKDNSNDDTNSQTITLNTPVSICKDNQPIIQLSWNKINNVKNYKIHSNRVFPSGEYFYNTNSTSTNSELSEGLRSNYSYRLYILAELLNGDTIKSNEVNVNTGNCDNTAESDEAPNKPNSLSPGSRNEPYPEISNTNIRLTWNNVSSATYYRVTLFDYNTINKIIDKKIVSTNSLNVNSYIRTGHKYFLGSRSM